MPNVDDVYSSNRLKAEHVQGRDYRLTITDAPVENCARRGERDDNKIVLYFHQTEKTMPLNVINKNTVKELYGNISEEWVGKQITLFQTMTEYDGKRVQCIRIRTAAELAMTPQAAVAPPAPAQPAQQPEGMPPIEEDDIPF